MHLPRNLAEKYLGRSGLPAIFVHTPKCGGRFVGAAIERAHRRCITQTEPRLAGHQSWARYKTGLAALGHDISDYTTFGLVRNPFSWQVSWYCYIRAPKGGRRSGYPAEHELFQRMSFSDYVDWLIDPDAPRSDRFEMGNLVSDWVTDADGRIAVNHLFYQERLRADVNAFKAELNLKMTLPKTRKNVSNTEDYRSFYSSADIDKIAKRHARDLDLLGYDFDGMSKEAAA